MKDFLFHPFTLGFGCVLLAVLLVMALYHLVREKADNARQKARNKELQSQHFEIQTEALTNLKTERDALKKENENLRMKIQALSVQPDQKLGRELEIFARAEKKMTIAAPGFASPWEQAKQSAHQELADEENGKAAPRSLFQRFFGGAGGGDSVQTLPASADGSKSTTPASS